MFISFCSIVSSIWEYNPTIKLIDSDFEEQFNPDNSAFQSILCSIVLVYERKGLPVIPNMIRAITFGCKINKFMHLPSVIQESSRIHSRYRDELDKYLLLI